MTAEEFLDAPSAEEFLDAPDRPSAEAFLDAPDEPVASETIPAGHPDRIAEIERAPLSAAEKEGFFKSTTPADIDEAAKWLSGSNPNALSPAVVQAESAGDFEDFKTHADLAHQVIQAPLIDLPKPENTSVATGVARGIIQSVEGLATMENAAIGVGVAKAPTAIQKLASLGFSGMMIKGAASEFSNSPENETPGEKSERITRGIINLLLGGLAAKHAASGSPVPISPAERIASMESARERVATDAATRATEAQSTPAAPPEAAPRTELSQSLPNPISSTDVTRLPEQRATSSVVENSAAAERPSTTEQVARAAEGPELLPEQAEVAAPKLDMRRSPFALGISPDSKVNQWLVANVKRYFTSKGDLPKETFEQWINRNGYVKEQSRQTAYATRDLYSALREEFSIPKTEELTQGFRKVPPEFVKQMNRALLGEVDINTLPERVRGPLQAMRQHVDAMSQTMLNEGVIPAELQARVADNLGTYLTRSYRVFDDPAWAEKIPQDVRNRARNFIYENMLDDVARSSIEGEIRASGNAVPKDYFATPEGDAALVSRVAELRNSDSVTPQKAQAALNAMLQDWKDQGSGALVKQGGKIGSKDLTSFIARKDIPAVIREAMGEYHDPLVNYTRSVTKMGGLIGNQRFLTQVRQSGLNKFLFEDGTQPASHSALISAEGSDVMAPLNGLRTTPEIATAFREFGKSDPIKNPFLRAFATLSGVAKSVKTVGSLMTQARNAFGQAYFFAANGHFDMSKAAPALKAVLADLGAKDTPAGRAAYQRYLRLGIVDQSAKASELRDIIRDSGLSDPGVNLSEPGQVWAKTAKKLTVDAAAKAYQVSDDIGKIIGFENELARQRAIHPEWSETTLEAATAERIRNTYPTYSMVPEVIKKWRRVPFGPFASFASETFRTAYHNIRYTIEDLKSSNPIQKKAGAQRLAGQLAVLGSGYALSAASRALLGMNAQEESDARRFMAPWDKDSQIMFTDKGDGTASFINLSYANPYSYLTDPTVAVAGGLSDGDELDEIMLRSFGKLLQPFTSEDLLASAIIDTQRNQTQTGQRVFNPGDSPGKRFEDKMEHVLGTLEPGTVTRFKSKVIPAIKGETDKTGRVPELSMEILNELTGFKQQTLDFKQAVGFKAREFKKADDDADSIFREVASRRGAVQTDEIADAYKRAARSKFNAWQNFYRDVQAARRRGVSDSAIRTTVEARGVSSAEAAAVMSGRFIPPRVSPALGKIMKDAKRSMPQEAVDEMRRAERLVLSGRFE